MRHPIYTGIPPALEIGEPFAARYHATARGLAQRDRLLRSRRAHGAPGGLPAEQAPILTGMGASFHAALAMVPYFHSLNVPAVAVEATDLFYYSRALFQERRPLVFISQSGK